jgi:hypothetical protein
MMKAIPVRIDDRPASEFDTTLSAGVLFWMTLSALAVISFAV